MALDAVKETKTETKPKAEKQANCLACNKLIKKLKRYYRDGKFYCSKRCWRAFINKTKPQGNGLPSSRQSHKPQGNGLASNSAEAHGLPSSRQSHSQSPKTEEKK